MKFKQFIYLADNYLLLYDISDLSTPVLETEFSELSALKDLLTKYRKNKTLILLSANLYANLILTPPFKNLDNIYKISSDLIAPLHYEKTENSKFQTIFYEYQETANKLFIAYIPQQKYSQLIENLGLTNFKITTFNQFLLFMNKNDNSIIANIYSEIDKIFYAHNFDENKNINLINAEFKEKKSVVTETILLKDFFAKLSTQKVKQLIDYVKNNKYFFFDAQTKKNIFNIISNQFNKKTITLIALLFFVGILVLIYEYYYYNKIFDQTKKKILREFASEFSDKVKIIEPIMQANSELQKLEKQNTELQNNSASGGVKISALNSIIKILIENKVEIKTFSATEKNITIIGEAQSMGDLDRIRLLLTEKLNFIKTAQVKNSKYKNVITNTGAEFELEILIK